MKYRILAIVCALSVSLNAMSTVRRNLTSQAAQGDLEAQYVLAYFNCLGIDGPQDTKQAITLLRAASAQKEHENQALVALAQQELSMLLDWFSPEALGLMADAVQRNEPGAVRDTARFLFHGWCDFPQDQQRACDYYKRIMPTAVSASPLGLGVCYLNGEGTVQSDTLARHYFTIARNRINLTSNVGHAKKHLALMDCAAEYPSREAFFTELQQRADQEEATALKDLGFAHILGHFVPCDSLKGLRYVLASGDREALKEAYLNVRSSVPGKNELIQQVQAILGYDKEESLQEEIERLSAIDDHYHYWGGMLYFLPFNARLALIHLGHKNSADDTVEVNRIKAIECLLCNVVNDYAAPYLVQLLEEWKADTK